MPPINTGGGSRRLIFVNTNPTSYENSYTPGSTIGALNTSVRRALYIRATLQPGNMKNPDSRKPGCGGCLTG